MDWGRSVILIRHAKGGKDRMVTFSKVLAKHLKVYLEEYQPERWLFEGQIKSEPYSAASVQAIFRRAKARAGIHKAATFHILCHSYATHLLEASTDVRLI